MNKLKVFVAILLVFILGALAGSMGTQIYIKHQIRHYTKDGPPRLFIMSRLARELDLNKSQRVDIEKIIIKSREKIHFLSKKFRPDIMKIIDDTFLQIRERLNDEQKQRLDELRANMKERGRPPFFLRRHHR